MRASRSAIIIGASSGIGAALARRFAADGWRLGLAARRLDRLEALAAKIGADCRVRAMDLAVPEEARRGLEALLAELGGTDLIVISAGTGELNADLAWPPDRDTIAVNVMGFAAVAQRAMAHLLAQGHGHLVGVSSVAKLRGSGDGAAYSASKAFVSTYLDGLRDKAKRSRLPITVTEICPGFVDTAMMKADKPFWVATPEQAAACIDRAIAHRARHAYVTPRWRLVGLLLRMLPGP
ncbi:SDR family NAD(P)-dependent oxidoreductase [Roseomonas terrae]|uniref:SDR family NAD(P)-dependent oxidoreductase n=1 Tax=Neoroseomonas terrae TaxID=424799 RepID=A0ABS5ENW5_9PROT|nr:SDR family NAD(P)-dependent oxidoreductase [Neoroseomonas terrae]MBR0652721.1 SDR family NAD(P)-dependent oxidoreductase [Neoroseomonas terrae]